MVNLKTPSIHDVIVLGLDYNERVNHVQLRRNSLHQIPKSFYTLSTEANNFKNMRTNTEDSFVSENEIELTRNIYDEINDINLSYHGYGNYGTSIHNKAREQRFHAKQNKKKKRKNR